MKAFRMVLYWKAFFLKFETWIVLEGWLIARLELELNLKSDESAIHISSVLDFLSKKLLDFRLSSW